jgi:hypothetical protein
MATIENPSLTIDQDPLADEADVKVACDVKFTDFEVHAMNELGLQYRLKCRLYNKDLWDTEPIALFEDHIIGKTADTLALQSTHALFETTRRREDLHTHVFSEDQLVAEISLHDEESGDEVRVQTATLSVDLTV